MVRRRCRASGASITPDRIHVGGRLRRQAGGEGRQRGRVGGGRRVLGRGVPRSQGGDDARGEGGDEAPDEVEVDEGAAPATMVGDGVMASAGSCPDPE